LGIWVFGYLGIWVFGYLGIWVFGYLGIWVFGYLGIKKNKLEVKDFTIKDIKELKSYFNLESSEAKSNYLIYFYEELKMYKEFYSNYGGNSYKYYIFKLLIKLLLNEIYLFKYEKDILTYREVVLNLNIIINNKLNLEWNKFKNGEEMFWELLELGEIKKIKYQCIKVLEPEDITYDSISKLKIQLVEVNKEISLNSLLEKEVNSFIINNIFYKFWPYDGSYL